MSKTSYINNKALFTFLLVSFVSLAGADVGKGESPQAANDNDAQEVTDVVIDEVVDEVERTQPDDHTLEYCTKNNRLNGIGLLNVITRRVSPMKWYSSNCSASIVKYGGQEFVITAAHCVLDEKKFSLFSAEDMKFTSHHGCSENYFESRVESVHLAPGVQEYFIKHKMLMKAEHDWAILKLADKAPDYINKYKLDLSHRNPEKAANFGFGAIKESGGFPEIADGKTLIGFDQKIQKLKIDPILKLSGHIIVGMSGGPIFDLETMSVLGVNSHAMQKLTANTGDWVYVENSIGSYPVKTHLDSLLKKFDGSDAVENAEEVIEKSQISLPIGCLQP